jgi:uncharacterized membrane protein YeaQ/YmgE (transglycosylase-associated protein family)
MLRLLGLDLLSNSQLWLIVIVGVAMAIIIGWICEFIMGHVGLGVIGNTAVVAAGFLLAFVIHTWFFGRARVEGAPALLAIMGASVVLSILGATFLKRKAFG